MNLEGILKFRHSHKANPAPPKPAKHLEDSQMNAIHFHARGGAETLVYEQGPTPQQGTGELLVRVYAAEVPPTEPGWAPTWTTRTDEPRPFQIIHSQGDYHVC